jgi:hypothetical protein
MIKQTLKNAAIDQTIKKFYRIFLLSIFIVLFYSTHSRADDPHLILLQPDGNVCQFNQLGWIIRQFPVASNSNNIALQVYNDKIYVLRKNFQVFVFDMDGKMLTQYFVDSKTTVWVK